MCRARRVRWSCLLVCRRSCLVFALFWRKGFGWIIPDALDDPQPFGSALAKEESIAWSKVLGPLDKPEGNSRAIAGPDEGAVDVDDGAGLGHGSDVQHCLVLCFYRGGVRQNKH